MIFSTFHLMTKAEAEVIKMTLIRGTDLADVWRMDENFTSKARYRISEKQAPVGRVSNPFAHPGQNGSFPDEFLTKKRVDSCLSAEPGETSDPMNPMKSIEYTTHEGCPAHPPYFTKIISR